MNKAARTNLCAIGLAMLAFVPPAAAWESDVHYGLTKWLALKAGFVEKQAEMIALGNVDQDRTLFTDAVITTIFSACLAKSATGAGEVHDHHFASEETVRNHPSKRKVVPGRVYAWNSLQPDPVIKDHWNEGQLRELGKYLHVLQDTWSHQGESDFPMPCDPDLAWGHPLKRGGWSCHLADQTYHWHQQGTDVLPMAERTYKVLVQQKAGSAAPWNTLKPQVDEFANRRSKWGKDKWFDEARFVNREFLQEISLPDCVQGEDCKGPYPFEKLIRDWQQFVQKVIQQRAAGAQPSLPPEFRDLLQDFVTGMLNEAKSELSRFVDEKLAMLTLSRALHIKGSCPEVYAKLMPDMLGSGFLKGWGARQPKEYCELAAKSGKGELSCAEVVEVVQGSRPMEIGADIKVILRRFDVPPYILQASFDSLSESYVAFVRFVHLPRDVLMLTARKVAEGAKITGIVWVPDQ
jgi:hypothetical protein